MYKRYFKEETIMPKTWFTSDFHFEDDRLNLYGRDLIFKNKNDYAIYVISNFNLHINPEDTLYVLGDVSFSEEGLNYLKQINGHKILIKGNYDDINKTAKFDISDELLLEYFDEVVDEKFIKLKDTDLYLNHYPTNGKGGIFNIVGHIHGTWKVQRNMINVGVDAWHFCPVSEDMILWQINGIKNHYDQNVFAGELDCNLANKPMEV